MASEHHSFSFLEHAARNFSSGIAVVDGDVEVSFTDLLRESLEIKVRLSAAGMKPGMTVGILIPNGSDFIAALFAVLGCDAVVLPVYPSLKKNERQDLYATSEMNFLLAHRAHQLQESEEYTIVAEWGHMTLIQLKQEAGHQLDHIQHPACIRFSSGTTGKHKGVVLSHLSVDERTAEVIQVLKLTKDDRVLWVLPMAFHYIATIMAFVRYGITLVVCNAIFAKEILETANRTSSTMLYASPMHLRLLASEPGFERFTTLKQVITTSSGIDQVTCERFSERLGLVPNQAYGIIEVGLPILNDSGMLSRASELGWVSGNYRAGILDEHGNELGSNVVGKLALAGPGMFDGYMMPSARREDMLVNGWFLTGDNALRKDDGMIVLMGREKAMINVSGNKVFPEEVEAVIENIDGVAEALVYAGKHPLTGEYVAAKVVLKAGSDLIEADILKEIRNRLTAYKVPREIGFARQIEKTATGKKKRTGPE